MRKLTASEQDEAAATAAALVHSIDNNRDMAAAVVNSLSERELRATLIVLAAATAQIVRDL